MGSGSNLRRRRLIRLRGYDYSRAAAYFITVVTQDRLCLFGDVADGKTRLNEAGKMIKRVWEKMPDRFPRIEMDSFIVMPNHIHGIIVFHQPVGVPLVGAQGIDVRAAPNAGDPEATTRVAPTLGRRTGLGDVVGAYKSLTTVEYGRGVRTMN